MDLVFALPTELTINTLYAQYPCREQQIRSIAALIFANASPCRNIVLHGLVSTGKTAVTTAVLKSLSKSHMSNGDSDDDSQEPQLRYAVVKSVECITGRHLLEQTVASIAKAVGWAGHVSRCENLSQLVVEIERMLETHTGRFVLVFDGIDAQRESPPTLLPALARMGEIIRNLTTIFITTAPRPNFLHLPGVPHIHFPAYTKDEVLRIIALTNPNHELPAGAEETKDVWTRFCSTVWDSLSRYSGRDIISFRSVCLRLWPAFIRPILDGTHSSSQFSRLLVVNRALLQNEKALTPNIVPESSAKLSANSNLVNTDSELSTQLPYFSRLVLVAAYLASYSPPRTDQLFFMKASAAKRKKKGGGTAKTRKSTAKNRKLSRKLLGPQAFVLERMLAIFHAIRFDAAEGNGKFRPDAKNVSGSADVQMAIATLTSLRFLVKMGSKDTGDTLDGGTKWRVAVGWEVVRGVGRSVGVEVEDYLAE